MFTGIVEELGEVVALDRLADSARLIVRGPLAVSDAQPGDSIAVNGCCLTVVEHDAETFTADVMQETLDKTSLGACTTGTPVNLERAVTAGTRLGGHIVQGHVDAVGTIRRRIPSEHWEIVEVDLPAELAPYLVQKGSITVDGVSLTVVGVDDGDSDDEQGSFTVSLIPETLARTTLGHKQPGDPVNLEVDLIAKYVERMLAPRRNAAQQKESSP